MNRKFRKNKKAMSIVISTVIIIAISITMAIAVAFWAMGLGNSFTKFEKLEYVSIYADIPVIAPFQTGTTATAQVTLPLDSNGGITNIAVGNPGIGYSSSPNVFIPPPSNGVAAAATAYVRGGSVYLITVVQAGSGYSSPPPVTIAPPPYRAASSFPVYIQLQNTGQIAATINNVFLDGKPYTAYQLVGLNGGQNLVGSILNVGVRNNNYYIYLPVQSVAGATGWKSGDYVEIEIQTTSGKQYSNTVLLP
jgi:hypothetical protein